MKEVRDYLLSKPEAWEDFPFRLDVAVFKVGKKMFTTLVQESKKPTQGAESHNVEGWQMNLKCDPEQALMLRDVFLAVIPGYHMNKAHWNTVILDGSIPKGEIERMIDHSYTLVVRSLPKKERLRLELHYAKEDLYP